MLRTSKRAPVVAVRKTPITADIADKLSTEILFAVTAAVWIILLVMIVADPRRAVNVYQAAFNIKAGMILLQPAGYIALGHF